MTMKPELQQYKVEQLEPFWQGVSLLGDGYDVMAQARTQGWRERASWGKDGWDLGSWPYAIIFFRNREGSFDVLQYVEGDVTMYACPTKEIRQQITDELAFFHWKHNGSGPDVSAYSFVDQLPPEFRGPYRP